MARGDKLVWFLSWRGKQLWSLRIMLAAGCSWMVFIRLRKFPSTPCLLSVSWKNVIIIIQKMQLFCFPHFFLFSFFPFLIPFQSLLQHQDDIRKEEATGCCASIPWSALWVASATSSLLSALLTQWCPCCSGTSCIPPALLFWLTVSWFWVPGFLSLFFRVKIHILSSRCARLLWQLLVFGKQKAIFQMVEFPFHFYAQFNSTRILWELFNARHCASLILIILTVTPWCFIVVWSHFSE